MYVCMYVYIYIYIHTYIHRERELYTHTSNLYRILVRIVTVMISYPLPSSPTIAQRVYT